MDLRPMTFKMHLARVKVNQRAKYLDQRSLFGNTNTNGVLYLDH